MCHRLGEGSEVETARQPSNTCWMLVEKWRNTGLSSESPRKAQIKAKIRILNGRRAAHNAFRIGAMASTATLFPFDTFRLASFDGQRTKRTHKVDRTFNDIRHTLSAGNRRLSDLLRQNCLFGPSAICIARVCIGATETERSICSRTVSN